MLLIIAGCNHQPAIPTDLKLKLISVKDKSKDIVRLYYWGKLRGKSLPCGCDILPLGGIKRRKKALDQIKPKFPDAFFLNYGGTFDGVIPKKKKEALDAWKAELEFKPNLLVTTPTDLKFIKSNKLPSPKNSLEVEKETIAKISNQDVRFIAKLYSAQTLQDIAKNTDKSKLNILVGAHSSLPYPTDSVPGGPAIVVLGSNELSDNPDCFAINTKLFCGGSWEGRSIIGLNLIFNNPNGNWYDMDSLVADIERIENLSKEEQTEKTRAEVSRLAKMLSENSPKKFEDGNYFSSEAIYLNKKFN